MKLYYYPLLDCWLYSKGQILRDIPKEAVPAKHISPLYDMTPRVTFNNIFGKKIISIDTWGLGLVSGAPYAFEEIPLHLSEAFTHMTKEQAFFALEHGWL